jgi:hypothetical protein
MNKANRPPSLTVYGFGNLNESSTTDNNVKPNTGSKLKISSKRNSGSKLNPSSKPKSVKKNSGPFGFINTNPFFSLKSQISFAEGDYLSIPNNFLNDNYQFKGIAAENIKTITDVNYKMNKDVPEYTITFTLKHDPDGSYTGTWRNNGALDLNRIFTLGNWDLKSRKNIEQKNNKNIEQKNNKNIAYEGHSHSAGLLIRSDTSTNKQGDLYFYISDDGYICSILKKADTEVKDISCNRVVKNGKIRNINNQDFLTGGGGRKRLKTFKRRKTIKRS